MKKILFAIAIVLTMSLTANAQGRDSFFSNWDNGLYNDRDGWGDDLGLPGGNMLQGGNSGNDVNAPLGSGLLVLTALGGVYALVRRQKLK